MTRGIDAFKRHLENDQFIGFAFEGYRAQLDNMPDPPRTSRDDAEPPPMHRDVFAELAAAGSTKARRTVDPGRTRWSRRSPQNLVRRRSRTGIDHPDRHRGRWRRGESARDRRWVHPSRGPGCQLRRDDISVDEKDVPVRLHIIMGNDIAIPGFQMPTRPRFSPGRSVAIRMCRARLRRTPTVSS